MRKIEFGKLYLSDHGELDGLGDDDHILYILADGTRALTGNWNAGAFSITAPAIIGGTATTSDLSLKTTSGVGATGADMHFLVGNNGATEAMTILNSGNVGIGTTAPSSTLSLGTNLGEGIANKFRIYDDGGVSTSDTSNSYGIGIRGTDGRLAYTAGTGGYQVFYTANTERLRITNAGDIVFGSGTGQSTVSSWQSNTASWINLPTTGPSGIGSGGAGSNAWIGYASVAGHWFPNSLPGDVVYRATGGRLLFGNSGLLNSVMAVANNRVGIGLTDPAELLEIEDALAVTGLQISNTATDGDPILAFALSGTKTFTMGVDDGDGDKFKIGTTAIGTNTRLTIDSAGLVGIGTDAPVSTLTVNGLVNLKNYTVATLPAGTQGDIAYVTDALAPAFLTIIVGGGAVVTPVFYNGVNWVAM